MAQTISPPKIDRAAIEAYSKRWFEPDWFKDGRLAALDRYQSIAEPTERTEGWRRTSLTGIDLTPPAVGRAIPSFNVSQQDAKSDLLVDLLEEAIARIGSQKDETLSQIHRGLSLGKYSALAEALWQAGGIVIVPAETSLTEPIVVDWDGGPYPRLVVVVGSGARATIVERHTKGSVFNTGVVDLKVGDRAQLTYVHVQDVPRDVVTFSHQHARVGRDAKLITLNFAIGGRMSRSDVEVELVGQGAESDMLGLVFGEGEQQFDFHTLQGHRAPDTRSDLLFKSALDDRSHSTYTGVISIGKDAPRSEAYQANRNLLLAEGARADTEPKLEILIDDVARCTHGATVGPVDDEQLFYLRSRGLDTDTASRLIVEGFFQEVFHKVGDDRVTADLAKMVAPHVERLGAH